MDKRPKYFTEGQLAKVGVELVDLQRGILCCMECGGSWVIDHPGAGKRLPKGYWHCPDNSCNVPDDSQEAQHGNE
jgi:hypothetical protein